LEGTEHAPERQAWPQAWGPQLLQAHLTHNFFLLFWLLHLLYWLGKPTALWLPSFHQPTHTLAFKCHLSQRGFRQISFVSFKIIVFFKLFIYSHVHTLFGSFLPPAPLLHPLPHSSLTSRQNLFCQADLDPSNRI
jgi:hypothetical protein